MSASAPIVNEVAGMGATHELTGGNGACEVLFVHWGEARLHLADRVVTGARGLCAGIPSGTPRFVERRSATKLLELPSAEVHVSPSEVA
jgi:hypothetical protein